MITAGCVTQSHHREKGAESNYTQKEEVKDALIHLQAVWIIYVLTCAANFDMRRVKMYLLRCGLSLSMGGRRTGGA